MLLIKIYKLKTHRKKTRIKALVSLISHVRKLVKKKKKKKILLSDTPKYMNVCVSEWSLLFNINSTDVFYEYVDYDIENYAGWR